MAARKGRRPDALSSIKTFMGHRIEFELKKRIILLSFFGIVTEESFLAGLSEGIGFVRKNGMDGALIDLSGVEVFQVSMDFIRSYVNTREIVEPTKLRIVIAPQPAIYGMIRAFQVYAESSNVYPVLVRSMKEGFELLKLDSPVFGVEPWGDPPNENSK
jgi:hypothetical protein